MYDDLSLTGAITIEFHHAQNRYSTLQPELSQTAMDSSTSPRTHALCTHLVIKLALGNHATRTSSWHALTGIIGFAVRRAGRGPSQKLISMDGDTRTEGGQQKTTNHSCGPTVLFAHFAVIPPKSVQSRQGLANCGSCLAWHGRTVSSAGTAPAAPTPALAAAAATVLPLSLTPGCILTAATARRPFRRTRC